MDNNEKESTHPASSGIRTKILGIGMVLVTAMAIAAFISTNQLRKKQNRSGAALAPVIPKVKMEMKIPDAVFTDQSGKRVQLSEFAGQYWIADIIFTRCPGPCVRMTRIMAQLQDLVPEAAPVHWISLTADPSHDTPEALARFADKHGADTTRWSFLTGEKADLYQFAIDGLRLAVAENDPEKTVSIEDMFIHSTMFVLVDRDGMIRGWYNEQDEKVVEKMGKDLLALFKEENQTGKAVSQVSK